MRKITMLAASLAALMVAGGVFMPSGSAAVRPPRQTTCFRGEYAIHAARPGASCFLGGLFIRTDLGGGHYDFIWGMARYEHGGLEHVVIRDDYTVPVNEMEVVLVGYVQAGPHHYWPFRNHPLWDKALCEFHWYGIHHPPLCPPVVNILHAGGRHDELHPPCIQDLSTTPIGTGALYSGRCSPEGQGAKDKRYTQMVWMPGHRIIGVRLSSAKRGFLCLDASLDPVNDAYVIWVPENEKLANLGVQYWYEIAHLHS